MAPAARGSERRVFVDPKFRRTERRRSYRLALLLFWSVLLALACHRYVIGTGVISDVSMRPTLRAGDYFLINKYLYHVTAPRRGDLVVLRRQFFTDDQYVKRVVGLPGDLLQITQGRVVINGRPLEEPYAVGWTDPPTAPRRLGPDEYFLLGDNRPQSFDSRAFGPVPRRALAGKIKPGEWFPFR